MAAERLNKLDRDISEHARQIDYLENQSRCCNVRIVRIPEEVGETWEATESKCMSFFTNALGLSYVQIERAHRTGPIQRDSNRPRSIIAKLNSYKHRETVLR